MNHSSDSENESMKNGIEKTESEEQKEENEILQNLLKRAVNKENASGELRERIKKMIRE
ncbi:MAG TPA: hypothetical protein PKY59_00105 [Pyrinomonadaceae bacterium]|nr:hypothetical protein [Pyrinomonadaceae bacterium]